MIKELPPEAIEEESMAIILREMGPAAASIPAEQLPVFQRVIHASADFDYLQNLYISSDALASAREALQRGCTVVTDTAMAMAGISKASLAALGCSVRCYMADDDVAAQAAVRGETRAAISMERAAAEYPRGIYAIGNAPTALLRLCQLIQQGAVQPALVVGVPVGFVNVVESKELLRSLPVPQITAMGRKGGSTVAAAVINALLYGLR